MNAISRSMLSYYQRKGIMNNQADCLDDLRDILEEVFERQEVVTQGMVALFSGWTRR